MYNINKIKKKILQIDFYIKKNEFNVIKYSFILFFQAIGLLKKNKNK